ncbi:uncharacterized protein TNIN_181951 [Trichonephila inaurata madagascariensis]|uniref:Peptidase aspartic putative domain-containing protein n=1 Tax=Trichonephila inaurata madagascariensis TaxID=2747483 RepID=A0A8X7CDC7_9ARAC|nr:uncharacterized protein TNIN_181951 [Trichonephila inaurata madagascariensis]
MFKGAKKEDLRQIAFELGETVTDNMTVVELTNVLKSNETFVNEPEFVKDIANTIISERKLEKESELELERIKFERTKAELELARIQAESKIEIENEPEKTESLDPLIKSVPAEFHTFSREEVNHELVNHQFAATGYNNSDNKTVLLSTCICYVTDGSGNVYPIRALMDVGASSNFMSQGLADRLRLRKEKTNISVSGLNNFSLTVKYRVNATITNEERDFKLNLDFLVVPQITSFTPSKPIMCHVPELQFWNPESIGIKDDGVNDEEDTTLENFNKTVCVKKGRGEDVGACERQKEKEL